jgi:ElaB/YqjD/DUF883 family membrane-anchored ribosome-binding protein
VIAQDIEQTREEMTGTLDAIQERLEPERLSAEAKEVAHYAIEEAKGAVRELADQASTAVHDATIGRLDRMTATARHEAQGVTNDMLDTIKANPIPAALTAVGIGWMLMHRGSDSSHGSQYGRDSWGSQATGYGSRSFDTYGAGGMRGQATGQQAQQMAGQFATQVQDRAGQMQQQLENTADQMQHRLGGTAEQVQEQAQGVSQTLQANPVAAAALGLGLGAIAGVAIPESEKENQLMGETRDRVVGDVQQVAGEKLDQAQHIAKEARAAAMEEAKSQVKSHGMMSGSSSTSASSSPA